MDMEGGGGGVFEVDKEYVDLLKKYCSVQPKLNRVSRKTYHPLKRKYKYCVLYASF
jgi:hypothetical protein